MGKREIDPREVRNALSLTLKQVADELGVRHSTIAGWETGRRTPSARDALRFARVLGVRDDRLGAFFSFWKMGDPNEL